MEGTHINGQEYKQPRTISFQNVAVAANLEKKNAEKLYRSITIWSLKPGPLLKTAPIRDAKGLIVFARRADYLAHHSLFKLGPMLKNLNGAVD